MNTKSPNNKLFAQPPFTPVRSENIKKIFEALALSSRGKLARELASLINTSSKQIFPRLKIYILKGWVHVEKINNMNIYSLTETARRILKQRFHSLDKIKERAEQLLGRKLDEDEVDVLKFFYELNGGYVEKSENESIAEQVYYALKRVGLSRITEILTEFTSKKILFAYRLRNGVILKVRLNKNLL
jgi:DNA-binding PadR family transcriptional regulator